MAKNWIASAIKKPGALRAQAKKAGAITKKGTIDRDWLEKQAKKGGKVGARARLALTLRKLAKRKAKMATTALAAAKPKRGKK